MVENQQKYKEPLVRVTSVVIPGNGYGCCFGSYRLAKGFLYAYAGTLKTTEVNMNKKFIPILMLLGVLLVPTVTHASWWNPFSWFKKPVIEVVSVQIPVETKMPAVQTETKPITQTVTKTITVKDPVQQSQINALAAENANLKKQAIQTATPVPVPAPVTIVTPISDIKLFAEGVDVGKKCVRAPEVTFNLFNQSSTPVTIVAMKFSAKVNNQSVAMVGKFAIGTTIAQAITNNSFQEGTFYQTKVLVVPANGSVPVIAGVSRTAGMTCEANITFTLESVITDPQNARFTNLPVAATLVSWH